MVKENAQFYFQIWRQL